MINKDVEKLNCLIVYGYYIIIISLYFLEEIKFVINKID